MLHDSKFLFNFAMKPKLLLKKQRRILSWCKQFLPTIPALNELSEDCKLEASLGTQWVRGQQDPISNIKHFLNLFTKKTKKRWHYSLMVSWKVSYKMCQNKQTKYKYVLMENIWTFIFISLKDFYNFQFYTAIEYFFYFQYSSSETRLKCPDHASILRQSTAAHRTSHTPTRCGPPWASAILFPWYTFSQNAYMPH